MTRGVAKQSFPTLPQQPGENQIASKPRLTVRTEYVSIVNAAAQPVCLGVPEYRTSLVGDSLNGSAAGFQDGTHASAPHDASQRVRVLVRAN